MANTAINYKTICNILHGITTEKYRLIATYDVLEYWDDIGKLIKTLNSSPICDGVVGFHCSGLNDDISATMFVILKKPEELHGITSKEKKEEFVKNWHKKMIKELDKNDLVIIPKTPIGENVDYFTVDCIIMSKLDRIPPKAVLDRYARDPESMSHVISRH